MTEPKLNEQARLVLLVGPPGSGKSTLAKEYEERNGFVRINQDEQGSDGHKKLFESAITENKDIIVDRMNFNKSQRSRYLDVAKAKGYKTRIIILHQNFETCFDRCLMRKNHPTIKDADSASNALNLFFKLYERVDDSEADEVMRTWPEGDKPPAVWIDIDNTLSNADHREHYLQGEKKDWKAFFAAAKNDPPNEWCVMLMRALYWHEAMVILCSGRPDDYRQLTIDWLKKHDIPYNRLFMRPRGCFRPDHLVKEMLYEFEIKTKFNLLFAVDDRKRVINQTRSHGIVVLDCAGEKGDF